MSSIETQPTQTIKPPPKQVVGPDLDPVSIYFAEGEFSHPQLTQEEEVSLVNQIQAGLSAQETLSNQDPQNPIPPDKLESLAMSAQAGLKAQTALVESNLKLVVSIAKRNRGRGLPFLDLIQEGNIGLIKAARKFELIDGNRFSTYAHFWIDQAIGRGIEEKGRTIRLPSYIVESLSKLSTAIEDLEQDLGKSFSENDPIHLRELEKRTGFTQEKIEALLRDHSISNPSSLNRLMAKSDTPRELGDLIPSKEPTIEEVCQRKENINLIRRLLAQGILDNKLSEVIILRFGLNGEEPMELREIGKAIGLTWQGAQYRISKALKIMREHSQQNKTANQAIN